VNYSAAPSPRGALPPTQGDLDQSTIAPTSPCSQEPTAYTWARMICPAVEVRKLVGRGKIVGVSTHRIEQARQAVLDGADYIGVGPIFPSATKPRDFVAGLDYARQVTAEISIPSVAIAGITEENVEQVIATGIKAIAVTAAVCGCEDVECRRASPQGKDQTRRHGEHREEEEPRLNVSHR